jgi:hypothetical protein
VERRSAAQQFVLAAAETLEPEELI